MLRGHRVLGIGALLLMGFLLPQQVAPQPPRRMGSGFVVGERGHILTCYHLVAGAGEIQVILGGKTYTATVVATDPANDLALLKVNAFSLRPVAIGNSALTKRQEEVWAMGYPLGAQLGSEVTTTKGTITAIRNRDGNRYAFQIDASISPGNSGGPLVNSRGEVVGVVNSKIISPEGVAGNIGFAVPIHYALPLLRSVPDFDFDSVGQRTKPLSGVEIDEAVSPLVVLVTVTTGSGGAQPVLSTGGVKPAPSTPSAPPAPAQPNPSPPDVASILIRQLQEKKVTALLESGVAPPLDMASVPGGNFLRGSNDGPSDEQPARVLYLRDFWIDRREVTNEQYSKFLAYVQRTNNHSKCAPDEPKNKDHTPTYWDDPNWNKPRQPIVGVDWHDAYAYAAWAGKRLPTEAEWEKAARGIDDRKFPWGNLWEDARANAKRQRNTLVEVGTLTTGISPYGAADMAGNVAEWCADWYDANYYRDAPNANPQGPQTGTVRVVRGGSFFNLPNECRVTARARSLPTTRLFTIGFRCAKDG